MQKGKDEKTNMCEALIAIRDKEKVWGYHFNGNWYFDGGLVSRDEAIEGIANCIEEHNTTVDKRMNERLWIDREIEQLMETDPPPENHWSLKREIQKVLGVARGLFEVEVTGDWVAITQIGESDRVVRMAGEKALRVLEASFGDELQDEKYPHVAHSEKEAVRVMDVLWAARETYKEDI